MGGSSSSSPVDGLRLPTVSLHPLPTPHRPRRPPGWNLRSDWKFRLYPEFELISLECTDTVVVTSLTNSQYVGYTDAITVVASNTTNVVPAGTAVSFLTIPAPTTTNLGASVSNTAVIPAPTAVTSGANTAKTTTAAMGGSGGAPVTAAGQTVASTAGAAGAAATTAAAKSGATMGRQVSLLAWVGGAVLLGMA